MAMFPPISSPFLFSLFLLLFLRLFFLTAAQPPPYICDPSANFTANSTYESNLINLLLPTLAPNASASGFGKFTVGKIPDQVYALVFCRGDINTTECGSCLTTVSQDLLQYCPYNKGAMIWHEFCFIRFSNNQQFLAPTDSNSQSLLLGNTANATNLDRFNQLLGLLLDRTTEWAMANSTRRFSTGEVSNFTSEFPTIYGMVQCIPDMSPEQCGRCLRSEFSPLPTFMVGRRGGKVIGDRCITRYEVYPFFEGAPTLRLTVPPPQSESPGPAPSPPPVPLPTGNEKGKRNITRTVLAVAIPVGTIILISIIICIYYLRRRKSTPDYETEPKNTSNFESIQFHLSTLRVATANFSEMNKLGEGGFGAVYKGLLPNGQEIAVKRLLNFGQGLTQLKNELVLVAKLQHRNLVRLLGVCLEEEKMIVYEYVPNRSLDTFLFDPTRSRQLHWGTRYKIIRGIARGLLYLHEESQLRIIHRDLKPSNVLLDTYMNPKIADFGLAKLFDGDQSQDNTNRVMGTFGYMPPEYVLQGTFSIKSDVFSFGVVVLEILTGRRVSANHDSEMGENLQSYTWRNWNGGTAMEIIDPALDGRYQGSDVLRCIQIGLLCVQENPFDRPTMRTVDLMLNSETISIQPLSRPAFCVGTSGLDQNSLSNNNSNDVHVAAQERGMSKNEVSVSELGPR